MTARSRWMGMMLIAALAACGEQGGELRDATERRRAATAGGDSLDGDALAADTGQAAGRVPAFVLGDSAPAATTPPAGAAVDSAQPGTTPPAPAVDPATQQAWTSAVSDRVRTQRAPVVLSDVRVGVNQGFDRVVLEFLGSGVPGYRVEYVDKPVHACGSGDPVAVAGDGWLAITLRGTQAHNDQGQATVQQRERRLQMPIVK
ncbi:MAG TPA: hypothetical protein VGX50_12790, partial [Longimicrobium sp.]|nr:hypothetical protein [Longimicrobium sp.]